MTISIPTALREASVRDGRGSWLDDLPQLVETTRRRWSLRIGPPFEHGGQTAWVAPARHDAGRDLVVKVVWRHPEAEHEADALRRWDGSGAVRLHRVERLDHSIVLLIERCRPGESLRDLPEPDQDVVIAGLLHRLWIEPTSDAPFRPLQEMCDGWADGFEQRARDAATDLESGVVRDGIAMFRSLPSTADRRVLLNTDLHAANVLSAEREPWLVIDPKPYVGDPTYDVLQHMLNCEERLHADPRAFARRMAELLDLDHERVMLWLFARCVQESPAWPSLGELARRIAPI